MKNPIVYLILLLLPFLGFSQDEKTDSLQTSEIVRVDGADLLETIDYLSVKNPMRASLYSAIIPVPVRFTTENGGKRRLFGESWERALDLSSITTTSTKNSEVII